MKYKYCKNFIINTAMSAVLFGCSSYSTLDANNRLSKAQKIFDEHCKNSGEKIYKSVSNIEGIYLLKVRREGINYSDQFALDDPYGSDLIGAKGYISSFLDAKYRNKKIDKEKSEAPIRKGYSYIDAIDSDDGKLYHFTGTVIDLWDNDKNYPKGSFKFKLIKSLIKKTNADYGITFEDISTEIDRQNWIAGSSLKIIDLKTNEIIAERIGYMIDYEQGNKAGGRSPWLLAAEHACPSFFSNPKTARSGPASLAQMYQAANFAEKVLSPKPTIEQ